VQAFDTTQWGTTYEAPIGTNTLIAGVAQSFEMSGFMFMAAENNTKVTLANGTIVSLQMGQSSFVSVKQGDKITSNKPIQTILLTGDVGSEYETRWFTMRSTYAKSYLSPVGDTFGKSKVVLYNPNTDELKYSVKTLVNGVERTETGVLASKQSTYTSVIPYNSGALVSGDVPFVALSVTDTEVKSSINKTYDSESERYDWGFSMIATNELTSQVLIGFGYGCKDAKCPAGTYGFTEAIVSWHLL
jgi:hypothetical protein